MSQLSDIKFFLKKYLKNPAVIAGVAYVIYKILNKHLKKESYAESIKTIESSEKGYIIYDDTIGKYIFIDNINHDVYSANSAEELKKFL